MASDDAALAELLDAYDNDVNEWQEIHAEGDTDVQVLSGDVWQAMDSEGAKQRRDANRPMLAPDEIGQYVNQVVNDIRENPRGGKFTPVGNGADDKGAEFYQNKMREIEYRSNASLADTTAFENSVTRSFGFERISIRYCDAEIYDTDRPADASLLNQEIWIDSIPDPGMVLPDPYAQRPDLSDMKRCFVKQWMPIRDFQREYPDAKVQNFERGNTENARSWFTPDFKQVLTAEYWTKARVSSRTLLVLKPAGRSAQNPNPQPIALWKDAINGKEPSSDQILGSRDVPIFAVKQRITNGVEILDTKTWPGKYIPITGCFGKILYLKDGNSSSKRQILSMIRLARDPFMLYAYLTTCEAEVVGGIPKFPYFYYEGQLSPEALEVLAKSNHEPVVGIPVKAGIPGVTAPGQPLPFPQRNPYDGSAIQYLEIAKEAARRAIQAAMGISPLPTQAQRHNEKSGKALQQIESSGQRGSFHFVDGYEGMIRQRTIICEDLMPHVYDTVRQTGTRSWDGTSAIVTINDPQNPESPQTAGDYQVTVSAGPSQESQRAAANDLVSDMVGNIAEIAQISGPDAARKVLAESIRSKVQGPSGDELAEVIDPPPPDGQAPLPPQVQAQLAEMPKLHAALQQAQQVIQSEQVKYASQFKIESMKQDKQATLAITLKRMDTAAKVEAARITAAKQSADASAEASEEAIALGLEHAHDEAMAHIQNAHDLGMAHVDQRHALDAGQQAHDQALEQGEAGVQGQIALQDNAPQPEAGA